MAAMLNIDRHIAIQAGWIAGPAIGVALMAAPIYFKLESGAISGLLFWGGIAVFLLTIAVVVTLSLHEEGKRKVVLGPILIMALGALIFCGGAAWYFWPSSSKQEATPSAVAKQAPLTMRDIFDSDFDGLAKISMASVVAPQDEKKFIFAYTEFMDFPTNAFFLAFYFERNDLEFIKWVATRVPNIITQLGGTYFKVTAPGDTRIISNRTMTFSKQIFMYFNDEPSITEQANIESAYSASGYSVSFRTGAYLVMHWREWNRNIKGASEKTGTAVMLPKGEDGMTVEVMNNVASIPAWFKGPPAGTPPPQAPLNTQEKKPPGP
jgi:hypothetical protein